MKKTLLAMLLAGSSSILFAQETQTNNNTSTNNTSTNTSTTTTPTTDDKSNTSNSTTTDMNTTNQTNSSNQTNTQMNSNNQMNSNTQMNTTDAQGNTISTNSNYNAYSAATAPTTVSRSFRQAYPGATNERWEQKGDWYRVSYTNNNQDMLMYYNARGEGYAVATPVMQTYVPTEVVQMVKGKYGWDVYDIKMIKGATGQNLYQVRIMQNGELRTESWDSAGTVVPEADIYRRDSVVSDVITTPAGASNSSDMNSTNSMNTTDNTNTSGSTTTDMNNTSTNNTGATTTDNTSTGTTNDSGNNTNNEVKIKAEATNGQDSKIKAKNGKVKMKSENQ